MRKKILIVLTTITILAISKIAGAAFNISDETTEVIPSSLNSPLSSSNEASPPASPTTSPTPAPPPKEEFSETNHQITINGQLINYKALAGNLVLKDDKGQPTATVFFVAYTKEVDEKSRNTRPLTFCFNGGPGSSSVWLHLGAFGPRRVQLPEQGDVLPPYQLIDNEYSLLDQTDLIFIDPVSTGYSTAIPLDDAKKFHGLKEDAKSIAEFIRLYTTRYDRWESPKFLAGESYGTMRAAATAAYLNDREYFFINGLVLISSILDFQSISFSPSSDLAYLTFLPSYTAAAWYHQKLAPELQKKGLIQAIQEARDFVFNDYVSALFKGSNLQDDEKAKVAAKLAYYTGLPVEYILNHNLRIEDKDFREELLKSQHRLIGRFDARIKGPEDSAQYVSYDPSFNAIFGAFTATMNHYLRSNLKWDQDSPYKILVNLSPWDYSVPSLEYLNIANTLNEVMIKNAALRVFIANGYYDLATPFFGTEYTVSHLGIPLSFRKHLTMEYYEAGHMMYLHKPSLIKLKKDLTAYYQNTLTVQQDNRARSTE